MLFSNKKAHFKKCAFPLRLFKQKRQMTCTEMFSNVAHFVFFFVQIKKQAVVSRQTQFVRRQQAIARVAAKTLLFCSKRIQFLR